MAAQHKKYIDIISKYLKDQPVKRAFLFGSFAKMTETKKSDLDILLELDAKAYVGLVKFANMKLDLEDLLKRKVDLLVKGGVSAHVKPFIDKEKVLIYER